jgi:hypothetical protein
VNIPPEVGHSQNIEYYTPQWIFDALPIEFDLDPCSPVGGPVTPAKRHYTLLDNGLIQPWEGVVWLNPPYWRGTVHEWIHRLAQNGNGIALVYARVDTAWFQNNKPDAIFFPRGRVRFIQGSSGRVMPHSGGSPSMLCAYGSRCVEALKRCSLEGAFFRLETTAAQTSLLTEAI